MTLDDSGSKSGSVTSGNGGGRGELFSEKTKRLRRAMGDVQRGLIKRDADIVEARAAARERQAAE